MSKLFVRSVCGAAAALVLSQPAAAAFYFTGAEVSDVAGACGDAVFGTDIHPTSAGKVCPNASAAAIASPGHVGVTIHASSDMNAIMTALAIYDTTVTILPLHGQDAQAIDAQLNLDFGGALGIGGSAANVGYGLSVTFNGATFSRDTSLITDGFPTHGSLDLGFSHGLEVDNQLSAFVGGTLTTPHVRVLVGQPIPIELSMVVSGFVNPGSLNGFFEHSLDFARHGDVFTLPDGYTAQDPEAFIVNNRFVPPGGGVPEPAGWALMIVGFGLAGATLRGRASLAA